MTALASVPVAAQGVTPAEPQDDPHSQMPMPASNMVMRAFGSVLWGATDRPEVPNSFTLGQLDLFMTSNLSERFSVLAEVVFEGSISTHVETDLERLQLTYRFNDYLNLGAGRYHTGIGYYNAAYHHGGFFETPIGRPRVFAFEDEGGVLPIHEVGIRANGIIPKTKSSLRYLVEVGNGRRWNFSGSQDAEVTPQVLDQNGTKATNVAISFRPDRWRGLEIGASFYRDIVTDAADRPVRHRIGDAYLAYRTSTVEVLAEWLRLTHDSELTGHQEDGASYVQLSKAWGRWRPYYRFDHLAIDPHTLFFFDAESATAHIGGLRVDFNDSVALKAQYERITRGRLRDGDSVGTQLVFVF
ncbi:MAG: hypothetical protein ABI665_28325 [Vicinamibacterales bacterium]